MEGHTLGGSGEVFQERPLNLDSRMSQGCGESVHGKASGELEELRAAHWDSVEGGGVGEVGGPGGPCRA